ncbi:MAG: CBS domain-containing protein [Anaerolineales bacterium]|jgi:CBS domain-containing protein
MQTIRQILKKKGRNTWTITPATRVFDALKVMAEKDVGALLVVDGKTLVGVFSERDYARKVILLGKSSKEMQVSEIMSSPPIFIEPDNTVEKGLALMSAKHVRHLPVMEKSRLIGIVTIGDLVRALIDEQKVTIDHLEKYILSNTSIT